MIPARSTAARARLFFALWPGAEAREALNALACETRQRSGGRAIPPERIHLTLAFIGAIERDRIATMAGLGRSIRGGAFDLVLDTLGYWRHNRIVWCGARECPAALGALAADLRAALERAGVRCEERPYVPHVTLVRDATRPPKTGRVTPCVWNAREFVLAQSVSARGAVRYAELARWQLLSAGGNGKLDAGA